MVCRERTPVDGDVVSLAAIEAGEGSGCKRKDSGGRDRGHLKERHGREEEKKD